MKKVKNKNGIKYYVVISLIGVLGVAGLVTAYSVSNNINVEGDYNNYEADQSFVDESQNLGAFPGPDIYNDMYFHDTVIESPSIRARLQIKATSTLNVADNANDGVDSMGYWTNNLGKDLICDAKTLSVDFITATGELTGSFSVGTTTPISDSPSWTNTTTATVMASTTVAATDTTEVNLTKFYASTNLGSYFNVADNGYSSSTQFIIGDGETLLARFTTFNATSSDDFVPTGGYTLVGNLNVDCNYRTE